MNKNNITVTVLLACIILGGFYYVVETNKQEAILKQQQAVAEKDEQDKQFANNLKCQGLLKDLKQRWNNVSGIYYSAWQNTCIVKYLESGEVLEAPIEDMQDK